MRRIYFDNASTANIHPEVFQTYVSILKKYYANSESLYDEGMEVHRMVETSREAIAKLLGVKSNEVIFTSGSSESNTSAIKGISFATNKKHIVSTNVEHSSTLNALRQMEEVFGYEVTYLPVNSDGIVTIEQVQKAIREDTALVSIMAVNNETGAIFPIEEICEYIKKHTHAYYHVDLTQAIGKTPIHFTNIDAASISAHKLHGLKGSGLLIKRQHVPFIPLINGGEQEFGMRGGTANAPADIVFAKTLRLALEDEKNISYLQDLKQYLLQKLTTIPNVLINSPKNSIASTLNFSYEAIPSEVMQNALNQKGFMVSARSTCDSRSLKASYVLTAMGYSELRASSCIRVSLSKENTKDDIDAFIHALQEITSKYGEI